MFSPAADHQFGPSSGLEDRVIVLAADGIRCLVQIHGEGRPPGEEIHDFDAAVTSIDRPGDAAFDRGIVAGFVGGAGIEQYEAHLRPRRLPDPAQFVTVTPTIRKCGTEFQD